jgi:hypothetical protein
LHHSISSPESVTGLVDGFSRVVVLWVIKREAGGSVIIKNIVQGTKPRYNATHIPRLKSTPFWAEKAIPK